MGTTIANPTPANGQDSSGALSQEKVTYRGYAKLDDKGIITDFQAKQESAKNAAWEKLEKGGYTLLNTVEFIKYTVNSDEGFKLLITDETQRLYIVQAGLNYLQNSKANGYMAERQEGAGNENNPAYNDQTIDLREAINEPPSKRALTDQQKLERLVKQMGLSPDQMSLMFAELQKRFSAAAQLTEDTSEEVTQ
ncbi:MAG TPA: hypothetical protein VII99_10630 [Bacteroidia bacterium]